MKLLRVRILSAETCGGFLDGFDISLRRQFSEGDAFAPLCLIGPNGCGKSQFLQVIAEIFQSLLHEVASGQERVDGNPELLFEVEYVVELGEGGEPVHVRAMRTRKGKKKPVLKIETKGDDEWVDHNMADEEVAKFLPAKIIGYTSGNNETLSLPFLLSRGGYAKEVYGRALSDTANGESIPDTRLMLIDYSTHLEVLVANLLLADEGHRSSLIAEAHLKDICSMRCVVQLNHGPAPKAPARLAKKGGRKGVLLTDELEGYIDRLRRCATCYTHDPKSDTYIFDFYVDEQTRAAFRHYWDSALELYSAFHKLAMLNDLVISKSTRERFERDARKRRFASRLPEPTDDDKVFRFERVTFHSKNEGEVVDYVSLSDGEHQLAQLLGTFCMASFQNVLFLLDEPESHFNPQWRVKFISRILQLATPGGVRDDVRSKAAQQECLLTTHAPFVASDTARDHVLIFSKDEESGKVQVRYPEIETFGSTFDAILDECFDVRPPISQVSKEEIENLMKSDSAEEIEAGMRALGSSVEKAFLADRLRQLSKDEGA